MIWWCGKLWYQNIPPQKKTPHRSRLIDHRTKRKFFSIPWRPVRPLSCTCWCQRSRASLLWVEQAAGEVWPSPHRLQNSATPRILWRTESTGKWRADGPVLVQPSEENRQEKLFKQLYLNNSGRNRKACFTSVISKPSAFPVGWQRWHCGCLSSRISYWTFVIVLWQLQTDTSNRHSKVYSILVYISLDGTNSGRDSKITTWKGFSLA